MSALDISKQSDTPDRHGKFKELCGGVSSNYCLLMNCTDDILKFKDEIVQHNLPPSLLLSLTLLLGKFYRQAVELGVTTNELVRLVKLYSTPWEEKSEALKKLHQDYEAKQKKLEIALKKLEMTEARLAQLESEKRVMNWEKLFAKVAGAKSHGQRWRFLIETFKQKLKSNDMSFYASDTASEKDSESDFDEQLTDSSDEETEDIRPYKNIGKIGRKGVHFKTDSTIDLQNGMVRKDKKHIGFEFNQNTDSDLHLYSQQSHDTRHKYNQVHESPLDTMFTGSILPGTTTCDISVQTDENFEVLKVDKEVWTHEPDYDTYLHIRVLRPECNSIVEPSCSIALENEYQRSNIFRIDDEDYDEIYKESERTSSKQSTRLEKTKREKSSRTSNCTSVQSNNETKYQDFSFKLSQFHSNIVDGPHESRSLMLKIAIHNRNERSATAMTTIDLYKTKIEKDQPGAVDTESIWSSLYSVINEKPRGLFLNQPCGQVGIQLFVSHVVCPRTAESSTETLSMNEIIAEILHNSRMEYLERCKSAGVDTERKPIYTQDEMSNCENALKEQLLSLHEEYQLKMDELLQNVNQQTQARLKSAVSCGTSPVFKGDIFQEVVSFDFGYPDEDILTEEQEERGEYIDTTAVKKRKKKVSRWGKDLPDNFFERMGMFQEARKKHFQLLNEKFRNETMHEYIEKMTPLGHLHKKETSENKMSLENLCLPALFMPTKTRTLCTPKARSYFHMAGNNPYRLTQPPPILSLPNLKKFILYPELVKGAVKKAGNLDSAKQDHNFVSLNAGYKTS